MSFCLIGGKCHDMTGLVPCYTHKDCIRWKSIFNQKLNLIYSSWERIIFPMVRDGDLFSYYCFHVPHEECDSGIIQFAHLCFWHAPVVNKVIEGIITPGNIGTRPWFDILSVRKILAINSKPLCLAATASNRYNLLSFQCVHFWFMLNSG